MIKLWIFAEILWLSPHVFQTEEYCRYYALDLVHRLEQNQLHNIKNILCCKLDVKCEEIKIEDNKTGGF